MKDSNYQLKITVSGEEKKRIEQLAKLRYISVPQYIKLSALGVRVQQVKEVFTDGLTDEDIAVLKEIQERSVREGYVKFDSGFSARLQELAKRLLEKRSEG